MYESFSSFKDSEYEGLNNSIITAMCVFLGINIIYYVTTGNYIRNAEKKEREVEDYNSIENA